MNIFLSPLTPENLVSRDGFGSPVPRQPARLYTQAESGAYLRGFLSSSAAVSIHLFKPPHAIRSVSSLSGHALAYRWRSQLRVRRHRASKPQDSSKQGLPWQVTMDQLICASRSHTHYWYEVGILKVLHNSVKVMTKLCQKRPQVPGLGHLQSYARFKEGKTKQGYQRMVGWCRLMVMVMADGDG